MRGTKTVTCKAMCPARSHRVDNVWRHDSLGASARCGYRRIRVGVDAKGPEPGVRVSLTRLIRSSVLMSLACCYIMWFCVYMAQLHPIIRACKSPANQAQFALTYAFSTSCIPRLPSCCKIVSFVAGLIDIAVVCELVDRIPVVSMRNALHLGGTDTLAALQDLLYIHALRPVRRLRRNGLVDAALEWREARKVGAAVNRSSSVVICRRGGLRFLSAATHSIPSERKVHVDGLELVEDVLIVVGQSLDRRSRDAALAVERLDLAKHADELVFPGQQPRT